MKTTSFFPSLVGEEENEVVIEEVSKKVIISIFPTFNKDKILGPNGWTIELSLGFMI